MFFGSVTYKKDTGLKFSNEEGTFKRLFDEERLINLLQAFDRGTEIRGEVLPENPIRFVVGGVKFLGDQDDFDIGPPYLDAVIKYLEPAINPRPIKEEPHVPSSDDENRGELQ